MLDNDHPSLKTTRRLAEQITGALRACLSMVYRDLKPENVMVDDDLNIKLIGFGTVPEAGLDELASHIAEEVSATVGTQPTAVLAIYECVIVRRAAAVPLGKQLARTIHELSFQGKFLSSS